MNDQIKVCSECGAIRENVYEITSTRVKEDGAVEVFLKTREGGKLRMDLTWIELPDLPPVTPSKPEIVFGSGSEFV